MKPLFLHWGPGGNSAIERLWFGDRLPMHWWDQPKVGSWRELVQAAEAELHEALQCQGASQIPLVAHSSGGQLALELAIRHPRKISGITLIGCNSWPPGAFLRLGRALQRKTSSASLSAAIQRAESGMTHEAFANLVMAIVAIPDFAREYWSDDSESARLRHFELSQKASPLDIGTFFAVMNDFIPNPRPNPVNSGFEGEVKVVFGEQDPLVDIGEESRFWKACFPSAQIRTLKTGHFVHFEAAVSEWLSVDL